MSNYIKPQSPLYNEAVDTYIYPLTTVDQIVLSNGERLNESCFGKGIELNYSIVGGLEEPSNPTENMIWVQTDTIITDWVFSKNEPAAAEGLVWFTIGNSGNAAFHELKINNRKSGEIYPLSAQQYINGIWVYKIAKSYQNGEWVDWWNLLYDYGNEYIKITGGWATWTPSTKSTETRTQTEFGITAISTWASAGITNPIDVTPYSSLKAIIYNGNSETSIYNKFFISKNKDSGDRHDETIELASILIPAGDSEIEIDISNITGYVYVGISDYSAQLKAIKKCWLQ